MKFITLQIAEIIELINLEVNSSKLFSEKIKIKTK